MRFRTHNEVTMRLWHDHFAWLPVKARNTWVWLETVKRKGTLHCERGVWGTGLGEYEPGRSWMTWEYELPEICGR